MSFPLSYDLTHCYLEVARSAMTQIHAKVPAKTKSSDLELTSELANAVFALVSMTVIYSFLALESFLNYQLYQLWQRREDGSAEAGRFLGNLANEPGFDQLTRNEKVRKLPQRFRTLCQLLGYGEAHEAIPDTWRRLKALVQDSRHFLVHPRPDPHLFQATMHRIMMETETGAYVRVVEEVLSFLYQQGGESVPDWVTHNTLLRFRGVDLLPVQDK